MRIDLMMHSYWYIFLNNTVITAAAKFEASLQSTTMTKLFVDDSHHTERSSCCNGHWFSLRQKKRIASFHLLLIGFSSDCHHHWKWKPVLSPSCLLFATVKCSFCSSVSSAFPVESAARSACNGNAVSTLDAPWLPGSISIHHVHLLSTTLCFLSPLRKWYCMQ